MSPSRDRRRLVVTSSFPAFEGDPSGHFVRAHAAGIASGGDSVTVVALGAPRDPETLPARDGVVVEWMGGDQLFGWPGATARLSAQPSSIRFALGPIARAVGRARGFDRVVAHWIVPCAFPIAWLAGARDLEVWAHGADVRLLCRAPSLARRAVGLLIARGARFVFVAKELEDRLAAVLDPSTAARLRASSRVEPAPIEVPPRETLADPRPASARDRAYVVWVGRASPEKRPEIAVAAAHRAGISVVMVGVQEDDLPPSPRRGDVTWLGRRSRPETLAWIAHARALILTSRAEGTSTVVREARALGVPVIAMPAGDVVARAERDPGITVVETEPELSAHLAALIER